MPKISAFIICKNEETCIENALKSLQWADETVVVDGFSTDKTVEIIKRYTQNLFQRDWTNFSEQRNFALTKLQHEWVFFLDADEVCSPELINWFKKFQSEGLEACLAHTNPSPSSHPHTKEILNRVDLFEIRRFEHFRGKLYKYGANNPSHQWRFFRKEGSIFAGEVHEYIAVHGEIRRLELPILHFPKGNLATIVQKMNRYSTLDAQKLFKQKIVHKAAYMFFSGLSQFLKAYFRKLGFLDGTLGFILAMMDGGHFFLRQAKLYLLNREAGRI